MLRLTSELTVFNDNNRNTNKNYNNNSSQDPVGVSLLVCSTESLQVVHGEPVKIQSKFFFLALLLVRGDVHFIKTECNLVCKEQDTLAHPWGFDCSQQLNNTSVVLPPASSGSNAIYACVLRLWGSSRSLNTDNHSSIWRLWLSEEQHHFCVSLLQITRPSWASTSSLYRSRGPGGLELRVCAGTRSILLMKRLTVRELYTLQDTHTHSKTVHIKGWI